MAQDFVTSLYVPADGASQSQRSHDVVCGSRTAQKVAQDMLADPDRYLRGRGRTVSIFNTETGKLVNQWSVPDA